MKKFSKVCLIAAFIMFVSGFALVIVSGRMTDKDTIAEAAERVSKGRVQMNLNALDDFGIYINGEDSMYWDEGHKIHHGHVDKYCPGENVQNLQLYLGGCTFITKASEDDKFIVEASGSKKFQAYVEEGTLYIRSGQNQGKISWSDIQDCAITLYVPENAFFQQAVINLGAGEAELKNLACGELVAEVGAGRFMVACLQADEVEITAGAGEVEITEMEVKDLDIKIGMGNCVAEGEITGDADIECGMGNVDMKLAGAKSAFNYHINGSMGNITIGDEDFSGLSRQHDITGNKAHKEMDIECGMGNITIQFED